MEHANGFDIPITLEEVARPSRLALLVYDMQVGVVRQVHDAAGVTARVVAVLNAARRAQVRTFFTRHMSLPMRLAGATQLRTAMAWQGVAHVEQVVTSFPRDSAQFQLVPEVAPSADEAILDKITMSAFVGTPLDLALRDSGVSAVAIVGAAMEVGIEPTVRHAMDLGYVPIVVTDACGAGDLQAADRSLAALAFTGGSFQTDSTTLCGLLGTGAGVQ
jgi:nicotinamidase-related amidase